MAKNLAPEQACGGSGVLTIDCAALRHNYKIMRQAAGGALAAAVVKADAYGLGADAVAPALYQAGCRLFFVAQYAEAVRLKPVLRAAAAREKRAKAAAGRGQKADKAEIAILNDVLPHEAEGCARGGFIPVLNSLDSVRLWAALCRARGRKLAAMLQCDSGMARLGLSRGEAETLLKTPALLRAMRIKAILSHLACGDDAQSPMNAAQAARFGAQARALAAAAEAAGAGQKRPPAPLLSLAASCGLALGAEYRFHLVRPGLALYGIIDSTGAPLPLAARLRPVIRLSAYILQIGALQKGETIGYGASYRAARAMPIATVSAGYADGWPRALSNKGAVYYQGVRLPIIGRISMDCLSVSLAPLVKAGIPLPARGAQAELIGAHQSIAQAAREAGMIPYEILTALGKRWQKRLIGG